ncbi:hypothetical protein [Hydrogenophaga defluvii]|uniref:Uncharacterized protein n=1 Tax=Hydrogenophaga defluvii TaxID=249410 RepID=A0ABW2SCY6_9BURK
MQRRHFIVRSTALSLATLPGTQALAQVSCPPPPTTTTPSPGTGGIDVVAQIKALRIPTGPYTGGYEIAPNGRLNWYFTQLGLLPIVQFLGAADLDTYIRVYLDLYLKNLSAAATIDDVHFPYGRANTSVFTKVLSDSDDAYAATFLSLAVRYVRASGNWTWWEANKARIKTVAYRNLALAVKRNGLISVFQAPRSETNSIGYLMDNCENYRGLRDLAGLLRERSEISDANYYDQIATNVATAMGNVIYNTAGRAFTPSDADPLPTKTFYPGTTCQVYAQAFGVHELSRFFDPAWNYLNAQSPQWEDGRYDPYPWAILGFAAAMRGQRSQAVAKQTAVEKLFTANRGLVTINELGFYQRTKSLLVGTAAV